MDVWGRMVASWQSRIAVPGGWRYVSGGSSTNGCGVWNQIREDSSHVDVAEYED
jgi:uncharacterized protein YbdZ (MbtH family)